MHRKCIQTDPQTHLHTETHRKPIKQNQNQCCKQNTCNMKKWNAQRKHYKMKQTNTQNNGINAIEYIPLWLSSTVGHGACSLVCISNDTP